VTAKFEAVRGELERVCAAYFEAVAAEKAADKKRRDEEDARLEAEGAAPKQVGSGGGGRGGD
jgi:hypothetical protein